MYSINFIFHIMFMQKIIFSLYFMLNFSGFIVAFHNAIWKTTTIDDDDGDDCRERSNTAGVIFFICGIVNFFCRNWMCVLSPGVLVFCAFFPVWILQKTQHFVFEFFHSFLVFETEWWLATWCTTELEEVTEHLIWIEIG